MYLSICPVSSPAGCSCVESHGWSFKVVQNINNLPAPASELMTQENKVPLEFSFWFFHGSLDLRHCRTTSGNSDLKQKLQPVCSGLVSAVDKYFFSFMIYCCFPHGCSK